MKWLDSLYLSDDVKDRADELIQEIESGRYRRGIYLVTLAMAGSDLLDIRKAASLAREGLREKLPLIVGLAKGREDAVKLSVSIVDDCVRETGGADVRSFLTHLLQRR